MDTHNLKLKPQTKNFPPPPPPYPLSISPNIIKNPHPLIHHLPTSISPSNSMPNSSIDQKNFSLSTSSPTTPYIYQTAPHESTPFYSNPFVSSPPYSSPFSPFKQESNPSLYPTLQSPSSTSSPLDHSNLNSIESNRLFFTNANEKPDNISRVAHRGHRRPRKMFTQAEVNNLINGVEMFGEGKWAKILQTFEFDDRTAVDLKDKWRNLQKPSSTVKVPKDRRTRLPYTENECKQLRYGVKVFGHNWVAILRSFSFRSERTPVDLKDKWRNLQIKDGRLEPPLKKTRRFLLLESDNRIFHNVYPRDAALRAASRGAEYIKLLQVGTPRIHVFMGSRKLVNRYIGCDKGAAWKGKVTKLGMERATVDQLRTAKINFALQFGMKAAGDIAPSIEIDISEMNREDIQAMRSSYITNRDVEVYVKLKNVPGGDGVYEMRGEMKELDCFERDGDGCV